MQSEEKYRKTFFFLEGIAFLILFQAFWTDLRLETIVPLGCMILGYKLDAVRRLSWFVMVLFSLFLIFLKPDSIDGYILGLCGVYILFNTSIFNARLLPFSVLILAALFLVQVFSVALSFRGNDLVFPRVIAIDTIIAILTVIFRSKFMGIVPREAALPVLLISGEKYSEREIALLKLVWEGKSAKEIASDFELSDGTVRTLLSRLYARVGVLGMKELYSLQYSHKIEWS